MHFGEGDNQGELVLLDGELEQGATSDDLQAGQDDPLHVHVGDEDVAGDLSDVLEEAEVEVLILEPSEFEVAVHIGAVGVSVPQVPVVVLAVAWHRHPSIGSDTN